MSERDAIERLVDDVISAGIFSHSPDSKPNRLQETKAALMSAIDALQERVARPTEALQMIVDKYDMRSELYTNDEDCAANLADTARAWLGELK